MGASKKRQSDHKRKFGYKSYHEAENVKGCSQKGVYRHLTPKKETNQEPFAGFGGFFSDFDGLSEEIEKTESHDHLSSLKPESQENAPLTIVNNREQLEESITIYNDSTRFEVDQLKLAREAKEILEKLSSARRGVKSDPIDRAELLNAVVMQLVNKNSELNTEDGIPYLTKFVERLTTEDREIEGLMLELTR